MNHVAGLWGAEAHIGLMNILRTVYRAPVAEAILLLCTSFQLVTGVVLVHRKLRSRLSVPDTLQTLSGAFLSLFLLSHLTAVLSNLYLRGVNTDFRWLTAYNLLENAWAARLLPYYFLAVIAFAVHATGGLCKVVLEHGGDSRSTRRLLTVGVSAGCACAVLIIAALLLA
ncbi:MAG TPA: hypothetical protein VES20_17135 [Bryobacteraceae bacterium]|nr:hypothetical protein [Bryobacteraceae bacterium]